MKRLIFLAIGTFFFVEAAEIDDFILGNKQFSQTLYADTPEWINHETDILLSPFALQAILAFLQSGAVGPTGEEIRTSTFLPNSTEATLKTILSTIQSTVLNKLYVENGFNTQEDFKAVVTEAYQALFEDVEFVDSMPTASKINGWVNEQTDSKFASAFSWSGDFVDKLTKDFLVNTLSVKKNWSFPFDPSQTTTEQFFYQTGSYLDVLMMTHGPTLYNFYESLELDAKIMEIPLEGEDTSMTVVLPNQVEGLPNVERQIDIALTKPAYVQEVIQLSFPKTTVTATSLLLHGPLERLGVQKAWSGEADLSRISGIPGEIVVNNIRQNTYLNIVEDGTQAIAAGLVNMKLATTKHVSINRPFLLYIKVNGIITFLGRVLRPSFKP